MTTDDLNGGERGAGRENRAALAQLTAKIVAAYVSGNTVASDQLPALIREIYQTLAGSTGAAPPREAAKPAVAPGKSVHDEFLICLEDGKHLKMLKRYLRATYDMSPEAYRKKWGLAADYPMVAPAYAAKRSAFAKQIGLGRKTRRGASD